MTAAHFLAQVFVGDKINAGIYCLSPAVLDRIEMRPTSIEKETFPLICRDGKLFAFHPARLLDGCWPAQGLPHRHASLPPKALEESSPYMRTEMQAGNRGMFLPMCL